MAKRRTGAKAKPPSREKAGEAVLERVGENLAAIADAVREAAVVFALEAVATYGSAEERARAVAALRAVARLSG